MVSAMILVNVDRMKLMEAVDSLMKIDGIVEVHTIAGEYDLVAIARVKDNAQLTKIITEQMCSQIPAIQHTKTLVALGSKYHYDADSVYHV